MPRSGSWWWSGIFVEGVVATSVARRRQMIERHHANLSIVAQCRLVSIRRSSFYYAPMPETAETLALMAVIDASFLDHPWYGSRQMARHLNRPGHAVGRRRVRRLMARMGLAPIYQRLRTSDPHPEHRIYPYLLRDLEVTRPGHVWCADIPYIPMRGGFLYLVAIMDRASRKVLAWRLSNTMDAEFCVAALRDALSRFDKPEIFNTDQGNQFTSADFAGVLRDAGVRISMDGRRRWMDELISLLPENAEGSLTADRQGTGFECKTPTVPDATAYFKRSGVPDSVIAEVYGPGVGRPDGWRSAIWEDGRIVAAAFSAPPVSTSGYERLLIAVDAGHLDRELYGEYLLDAAVKQACSSSPTAIRVVNVSGQPTVGAVAKARGFVATGAGCDLTKVAIGRPVTESNWDAVRHQARRKAGLNLPTKWPDFSDGERSVAITHGSTQSASLSPERFEDLFGLTLYLWRLYTLQTHLVKMARRPFKGRRACYFAGSLTC